MIANELKKLLQPFRLIVSRNAINPAYRAIEINPNMIRACATYGIIEVTALIGVATSIYVDASAFLAVVFSSPGKQEFELSYDNSSLSWVCGNAKGQLALIAMEGDGMPSIEYQTIPVQDPAPIPVGFAKALDMGAISCDNAALSAIGMYGIVVDQRDGLVVNSTDNMSVSICRVPGAFPNAPEVSTLPPEGAKLLADIIKPSGGLLFDERAWYYWDEQIACKVMLLKPLKSDIATVRAKFIGDEFVRATLPRASIETFIKRANALSEVKRHAVVGLSAGNGRMVLSFKEGSSTADEYFEVADWEGLPDMPELLLNADKTARALSHVTDVILDNLERGVIIFRGYEPDFTYLLSGKAAK